MHCAQQLTKDNICDKINGTKNERKAAGIMKKILVLFTGGTIGSSAVNSVINVDAGGKYLLIEQYQSVYGDETEFECRQILNILSENITSDEWEILCGELSKTDLSAYSGVIITHGSDTLAYTSALIGMLFRHSPVPIILIAANLPLNQKGTNGLFNFACGVKIISDGKYKGIFTVYEKTYLSTRMLPADTCLDRFSSYGGEEFAGISEKMLCESFAPLLKNPLHFKKHVLKIHGYPDMDFSAYRLPEDIGGVLYSPYHSGTACMRADKPERSFSYLADMCSEKNIPLYICGVKSSEQYYASLAKIMDGGVKTLGGISDVSAYMKLAIAINQNEYPLDDFMSTNIYFEML